VQSVKRTKLLTGSGERDDCCLLMIYTQGGPKNWTILKVYNSSIS